MAEKTYSFEMGRRTATAKCAFIELQPANAAMILQVFPDARFVDAEVVGELFLHVCAFTVAAPAAQHVGDADAQRLAGFGVVIRGLIGVRDQKNAWAGRSFVGLIERVNRARQKAAKLRFELRHT